MFAAREKDGERRHFAVKVLHYVPRAQVLLNPDRRTLKEQRYAGQLQEGEEPPETDIVTINDPNVLEKRSMAREAYAMHFVREQQRFCHVDSAYIHDNLAYVVMNQYGVDDVPLRDTAPPLGIESFQDRESWRTTVPTFRGYNGEELIYRKKPRLTEAQARKIMSELLEALVILWDMKMINPDLSHRNYLLDGELNVCFCHIQSKFPANSYDNAATSHRS